MYHNGYLFKYCVFSEYQHKTQKQRVSHIVNISIQVVPIQDLEVLIIGGLPINSNEIGM